MATGLNTIVLKGKGHHDEGIADAAIYPGEAVRMAADGHFDPEQLTPDAAVGRGMMLAKEDALQGHTVDTAYAATDTLFFYIPLPGDHVQVLAKTGEDINVADYLDVEGSGSGKFIKVSASATAAYPISLTSARRHDDVSVLLGASVPTAVATTTYKIPITSGKVHDALATDLPAAAANDDMGVIGAAGATPVLQSIDFKAASTDECGSFEYIIPQAYVAGQALTVRVMAGMITTVANPGTATTVDCLVYRDAGDGTVSADLCTTAAQSINSLTHANKDFVVTPTTLVPGDRLIIELDFAGTDSGTGTAVIAQIDGVSLVAVTTAQASDDMALVTGTPGTNAPTLRGVDFGGTTSDEKAAFEYILPDNYRAGSIITVRVKAGVLTTVSHQTLTLDCEAWKDAGTGLVGADLCATAAQSINSLVMANKDFTITPTGLVAGDKLIIRLSFAGTDDTDAGVMIPEIQALQVLTGNAAQGRLESLEDTGGALAAAALVKCRVMHV